MQNTSRGVIEFHGQFWIAVTSLAPSIEHSEFLTIERLGLAAGP